MNFRKLIFRIIYKLVVLIRGESFKKKYIGMLKSQYFRPEDLEKIQLHRLNKLIDHARKNVPYYSYLPNTELQSLEQLTDIRMLEKSHVREFSSGMKFRSRRGQRTKTSGGSTGAPVTIMKDSEGFAQELAATWRGYSWAGIGIGDRQIRFWGIPRSNKERWKSKLIDFVCNRFRVSAFEYNDEILASYFLKIKRQNPDYFYGYLSIIKEFARFVDENGMDVDFSIKAIITTSEVLTEPDRAYISAVFKAPVYNEYGCGEVGTIAHECEYKRLHVNSENVILEVVDSEACLGSPGKAGEIVITDLTNYSMPLIRYRIKDWAEMSASICKCGRNLPVIESVFGREYDVLINSNGERFHGEFFLYIIEDLKKQGVSIEGVQFIQTGSLDIVVKIICNDSDLNRISLFLRSRLTEGFDADVSVTVEKVTKIDRESSGKLRVVKREGI